MATFILVPGAWLGAWCWKKVTPQLEKKGHQVYPVTLTGMGDRVHLARPEVGMETGIQDVSNLIKYEDLDNIILLGHSFAGKIAAAVADRHPDKVREVLYLDSWIPEKVRTPQGAFSDEFPVQGSVVPLPEQLLEVAGKDVQGEHRKWMMSNSTPIPVKYFRDAVTLMGKFESVKASYIFCTLGDTLSWYLSQSPGKSVDEVLKNLLDGPYRLIETGHWPMITKPEELAKDILDLTVK